jgi:hypothetical protein
VTTSAAIPYIAEGHIDLGGATNNAINRLAKYASRIVESGKPIPQSPFITWAADRLVGKDKQDLVFFLQGRRGSGKSYSCLYISKRLAEAIAARKGGVWQDYFSLENCATLEDSDGILQLLSKTKNNQVVVVDDASVAISNRAWNSQENRNWNALLTVCRTRRWALFINAPLRGHVDIQTRQLCDFTGTVYKSFHAGGFNILKVTSSEMSTTGKEYNKRLSFNNAKVDFWVTFLPDEELARKYDETRSKATETLNERVLGGNEKKEKPALSIAQRNTDKLVEEKGDMIRKFVEENEGKCSIRSVASKFKISHLSATRVIDELNLRLEK